MKVGLGALILLLLAVPSVQANDISNCEAGSGVKVPPHEGCTGVTDGPSIRNGYLVDCKGGILCKLREVAVEIVDKDEKKRKAIDDIEL